MSDSEVKRGIDMYMWRISIWLDGSTRLSSDLLLPLSQLGDSVYAISITKMRQLMDEDITTFTILVDLFERFE